MRQGSSASFSTKLKKIGVVLMLTIKALSFNTEVGVEVSAGPVAVQLTLPTVQQVVEVVEKESPKGNNC
jgi:hypothetical protein